MWKDLTTSPASKYKTSFKERMQKDTGLMKISPKGKRGGKIVTEERLEAILPDLEKYYELWLAYPDKLVSMLLPPETMFALYPFQILAIRANMRYVGVFQGATRGFSKSFVAVLSKMLKCTLLPRTKETLVSKEKQQAIQIGTEKVREMMQLMPLLKEEIDWRKGSGTQFSADAISLQYKHKSQFDIVPISEGTRGGRRHGILFEEAKDLPAKEINGAIIPLLNISRRTGIGLLNKNEPSHQQLYVGSTGYVGTFAHDKAIEILLNSVFEPDKYFSWGGSYRIPMHYGLLDENFVKSIRDSSTYDEDDFSREYESKWSSTVQGALFDHTKLQGLRKIKKAEWKARPEQDVFYVASVDVARSAARTVIEIFKVRRGEEFFTKSLVNIVLIEGRSFISQSAKIKMLDQEFDFEWVAIDANGMGVGLIDVMMAEGSDPETGRLLPPWNIRNIKDYPDYVREQKIGSPAKIWVIKTNQHNAGKIHTNAYNELFSGKVKLLINEGQAKSQIMGTVKGQKFSLDERIRILEPYKNTSLLISETSNLKMNRQNVNMKLEMIRSDAQKDTFSALEYGLWTISEVEKEFFSHKRKRKFDPSKMMFFN